MTIKLCAMNLEFFHLIIKQCHNLANTINRSTLTKQFTDFTNNQTMTAIIVIWQECLEIGFH